MKRIVLLMLALAATAGCVSPPPTKAPLATRKPPAIGGENARQRVERSMRAFTVRVRNLRCDGVAFGSGFAIDKRTIVTNRHVVDGAHRVEVETWYGEALPVASVEQAIGPDLAIVRLGADLPFTAPKLAPRDPNVEATLHLLGYPGGKEARVSKGVVVRYLDRDPRFDPTGKVMEMSGAVIGGNSGGPITDEQGRVVGVVFAYEYANGWVMAVPVSRLRALLDGGARQPVVPC
jgi:S1-C subfamily serine protease